MYGHLRSAHRFLSTCNLWHIFCVFDNPEPRTVKYIVIFTCRHLGALSRLIVMCYNSAGVHITRRQKLHTNKRKNCLSDSFQWFIHCVLVVVWNHLTDFCAVCCICMVEKPAKELISFRSQKSNKRKTHQRTIQSFVPPQASSIHRHSSLSYGVVTIAANWHNCSSYAPVLCV